jgi:fused signal recognition particle receptor
VVIFLGVNGVGKTTTIGSSRHSIDRPARKSCWSPRTLSEPPPSEQLDAWGSVPAWTSSNIAPAPTLRGRLRCHSGGHKRGIDVLLIDTAGRLHTKVHLIEELKRSAA